MHMLGDTHLYGPLRSSSLEQITREPRVFPIMKINPEKKSIDDFTYDDFTIEGYDPHPPIKGEITVVGGFNEKDRKRFYIQKTS